jgi:c-di-GMP-binding flagellar brake protein YcgR
MQTEPCRSKLSKNGSAKDENQRQIELSTMARFKARNEKTPNCPVALRFPKSISGTSVEELDRAISEMERLAAS